MISQFCEFYRESCSHPLSLLFILLQIAHTSGFIKPRSLGEFKIVTNSSTIPEQPTKEKFSHFMDSQKNQSLNIWKLAVKSGLCHVELSSLGREDIDLEPGSIRVQRNLTSRGVFGSPKTSNHRAA